MLSTHAMIYHTYLRLRPFQPTLLSNFLYASLFFYIFTKGNNLLTSCLHPSCFLSFSQRGFFFLGMIWQLQNVVYSLGKELATVKQPPYFRVDPHLERRQNGSGRVATPDRGKMALAELLPLIEAKWLWQSCYP